MKKYFLYFCKKERQTAFWRGRCKMRARFDHPQYSVSILLEEATSDMDHSLQNANFRRLNQWTEFPNPSTDTINTSKHKIATDLSKASNT